MNYTTNYNQWMVSLYKESTVHNYNGEELLSYLSDEINCIVLDFANPRNTAENWVQDNILSMIFNPEILQTLEFRFRILSEKLNQYVNSIMDEHFIGSTLDEDGNKFSEYTDEFKSISNEVACITEISEYLTKFNNQ